MGESERYIEYKNLKNKKKSFSLGQSDNAVMAVVALNVIFFLLLLTLQVVYYFYQQSTEAYNQSVVQWFELPSNLSRFIERPWTLLTFMFSDTSAGLMRLISNMVWFWVFASILQKESGNEKIIPVYIYGGLLGGLFFIIGSHFFSAISVDNNTFSLIGANASVLAVATATTFLVPEHRFFTHIRNGIPLWVLLVLYFIIDSFSITSSNSITAVVHLGGIVAGLVFVLLLKKGVDASVWMNRFYFWITQIFTPKENIQSSVKQKHFYNTGNREPYNKLVNQQMIDAILDKINTNGYDSLTEDEKECLKKAAEEDDLQ
jgi:membrane associated rhomboid family serine protease